MRRAIPISSQLFPFSLLLAALPTACLSTYSVQRPVTQEVVEQLNSEGMEKSTVVDLRSDPRASRSSQGASKVDGRNPLRSQPPSTSVEGVLVKANLRGIELRLPESSVSIPFAEVQRLQVHNHAFGAMEGLAGGIVAGAVVGAVVGVVIGNGGCDDSHRRNNCPSAAYRASLVGVAGGMVGGGLGALLGAALGHTTTFDF